MADQPDLGFKPMVKHNIVGWFELPVLDMDRAMTFYHTVFDVKLDRTAVGTVEMAFFPMYNGAIGSPGALVKNPTYKPNQDSGVLIYLTSPTGDISLDLQVVERAGGKILEGRRRISEEYGFMAVILDTEGNRVAIHSRT